MGLLWGGNPGAEILGRKSWGGNPMESDLTVARGGRFHHLLLYNQYFQNIK